MQSKTNYLIRSIEDHSFGDKENYLLYDISTDDNDLDRLAGYHFNIKELQYRNISVFIDAIDTLMKF